MQRSSLWMFILFGLFVVFVGIMKAAVTYTDYLWFGSLQYEGVFVKILLAKVLLWVIFGGAFFAIVWLNLRRAVGRGGLIPYLPPAAEWSPFDRAKIDKYLHWGLLGAVVFISIIAGTASTGKTMEVLTYLSSQAFGMVDPVFHNDLSLYVFKIPFLKYCLDFAAVAVLLAGIGSALVYGLREEIAVREGELMASAAARSHLAPLIGVILLFKAIGYWLGTYGLLVSERGYALGAAYTDVSARLPVLYILAVIAFLAALVWLLPLGRRVSKERLGLGAIAILVVASFVGWVVYPNVIQRVVVSPNEAGKERPYIERNIEATRHAFDLHTVKNIPFEVSYSLSGQDLANNQATIDNTRLWDHRPLRNTYRQLQTLRPYYQFSGVDTDRYFVNGRLTQVMLAGREMNTSGLQEKAQTWVNERLKYTHGYGVAMSPANTVTSDGQPAFIIKDIPPVSDQIAMTRPELYYGELLGAQGQAQAPAPAPSANGGQTRTGPALPFGRGASQDQMAPQSFTSDYVIVQTSQMEFDYPKGVKNVEAKHEGTGGVRIGSLMRRLMFALRFRKTDIAFTTSIENDSRILFGREIKGRVQKIAPFLALDKDPYLVIADGQLYWILDTYTMTDRYPYSQRYTDVRGHVVNYVRNSVKVVMNAYSGETDFYVFDTEDPLVRTYQHMFPGLFKPMSEMPSGVMEHIRYPIGLFSLQAQVLTIYHMDDPQVFYSKEDQWNLAQEVMSSDGNTVPIPMEPYYMVMKVPGETGEEFVLIVPFTPYSEPDSQARKDNMIAWMAARCGPKSYGELMLFEFPKDQLIYGPAQIGARIDQDPEISAAFTLWGQRGSSVIRGHLLVIPIEHSLLYVQPIYLQAQQAAIPQLERVIVAFGEKLAMKNSLAEAMQAVFGRGAGAPRAVGEPLTPPTTGETTTAPTTPQSPALNIEELIGQAEAQLNRAEDSQRKTQQELESLKDTLRKIKRGGSAP